VEEDSEGEYDDEDDDAYEARAQWYLRQGGGGAAAAEEDPDEVELDGGYRLPSALWDKLFNYQQTGVKWLWELHTQRAGGVIGDEMGLGKTIQMSVFLAGLHHSGKLGTSLIVAPATVLRQWMCEMRTWYPLFRVIMLHDSMKNALGSRRSKDELLEKAWSTHAGIVLTTYEGLRAHRDLLLPLPWSYVVLDEGHKIRNPDADVTLVCKQVATVHRIILSGSPIQNRLQELWSLFDFVFPGKLGTLPVFQTEFAVPITIGGYTNANAIQVSTAFRCAITLRDLINPYLLRRKKADVNADLPNRTEQVLFCKLTNEQRDVYRAYLASSDVQEIFGGNRQALQGIDILRKICNHPDLLERKHKQQASDYGATHASGKLAVTAKILSHWRGQGHKALLFTQTQQMLDILEGIVQAAGYKYHRMDGCTAVAQRSRMMHDFNNNPSIFVFLLTTKVGGLGVNLTGANRVLLYDPDWNPSTDMQARERAWRIGQKRDVTIYRLITTGTIEEKVYHRQIYKQFLTNKVLNDPKQKRFFTAKNIRDLFTLGEEYSKRTETERIFHEIDSNVRIEDYVPVPVAEGDSNDTGAGAGAASGSSARAIARDGSSASLQSQGTDAPQAGDDDSKVLRDLMEGSLMSAVDHAKIEGASSRDRQIMDQEAARIAQRAAQRLRDSRRAMMAARTDIAEPTWTGRSGSAGAPRFGRTANPRFGPPSNGGGSRSSGAAPIGRGASAAEGAPSSSSLLAQLNSRQEEARSAAVDDRSPAGVPEADTEVADAQTLAAQILSYMQAEGGRVDGARLVQHFQAEVPPERKPLFRELLKNIAVKQRRRDSVQWTLKPEFAS